MVTHLPTVVIATMGMATAGIEPSELYPVVPGCFLDTAASGVFWNVITFAPSVVRGLTDTRQYLRSPHEGL